MKSLITSFSIVLLLSFIISGDGFAQPKQKFQKRFFKENMIEKLNLNEEQENKISELRAAHQKGMIDLKAELEKKMIDMRELNEQTDLKRAELISTVESINSIKNKIAIAMANHKMDVLEILNAEQKKIWLEHEPFRDHMKMKFKERRFGFGRFGCCEFGPPPHFDNDEPEPEE
ncbi:MAG: hypothetical protein A2V93_08670 [Ignavibacteria bacterium RBG_16_34_14]|nr:MAG: hypothetical protein A2V93_08670 [Ignavibacteria bacterium RBG_16_34_14]